MHSQKSIEARERVITYFGTELNDETKRKSAIELKLVVTCTMIRHFRHYLVAKQLIVTKYCYALTL